MTNFDTMNIDSYQKDIFYNAGGYHDKIRELFSNLYYLLTLQALSSLEAFKDIYKGKLEEIHYAAKEMIDVFHFLAKNLDVWDKKKSLAVIMGRWDK